MPATRKISCGEHWNGANAVTEASVVIDGVEIRLGRPVKSDERWIGQYHSLRQLLACWLVVAKEDRPLAPRIVGLPGMGKTTLAMVAAKERDQKLFIFQCTADTRPEDLLVTPVLSQGGTISYHASPLVTAMITGGVCVLDEGNRMNEKSWASLAPLLDHRRYVESIIAGVTIQAHDDFRCCVTMNQDESTFEIPDYILSRLQPTLAIDYPNRPDELEILRYHLPFAEDELLSITVDFLQQAHELKLDYSPRDGINILRYALKRRAQDPEHPLSRDAAWQESLLAVLGEEAVDLEGQARKRERTLGAEGLPTGLADFFFMEGDPLRPDDDDDEDPLA
ncbi:MAG: AAA family ATPase [Planctomycetes bacterium]|nr:AAA family ATPase [Planctomycetota bacterium]